MKNYTNEQIKELIEKEEKNKRAHARYNMKRQLMLNKAIAQGIVVTDKEVDDALKTAK